MPLPALSCWRNQFVSLWERSRNQFEPLGKLPSCEDSEEAWRFFSLNKKLNTQNACGHVGKQGEQKASLKKASQSMNVSCWILNKVNVDIITYPTTFWWKRRNWCAVAFTLRLFEYVLDKKIQIFWARELQPCTERWGSTLYPPERVGSMHWAAFCLEPRPVRSSV